MELIETTFIQIEGGFEHTVRFSFEGKTFMAYVVETMNETFIRDCFEVQENLFPIDIPKYFGEFKSDVYTFIYASIQKGFV